MDKVDTVALMAATMYAAKPASKTNVDTEVMYGRIAAQAWALYDAIEIEAARRHSRQ